MIVIKQNEVQPLDVGDESAYLNREEEALWRGLPPGGKSLL